MLSVPACVQAKEFAECRQFFPRGQIPIVPNQASLQLRDLCFSSFAVMHSGRSRTPLYVVERLNKDILFAAKNNQRSTKFYAEARLPAAERAELNDYKHSGYDRGHMAPAGDMATAEMMAQSFSLSNMVPQAPINNRKAWNSIEMATRKYVMRAQGDVFVITGPVFSSPPKAIDSGRVWVPDYLFKLVYDPATGRSWAHWIENADEARPGKPISYAELVSRSGIQFLPN
ncbi:endonuclease G [Undibacterium sp. GrIS 1.2]|uniref:DNA/RNA non-specific endonuclease n=1 Tax=Undibacterium sp. GrIS 1.2 TaxID=3143933 RepID=UPI003395F8E7